MTKYKDNFQAVEGADGEVHTLCFDYITAATQSDENSLSSKCHGDCLKHLRYSIGLCLKTVDGAPNRFQDGASVASASVRARPIDALAPAGYRKPEQLFCRCAFRMVVERTCPLVKTSSVPRVPKSETMEVQMMAELVTQRTQKTSE